MLYVEEIPHLKIEFFFEQISASVTRCSFMAMTAVEIARSTLFIAATEQRRWRVQ
jgi:hypothetical protein